MSNRLASHRAQQGGADREDSFSGGYQARRANPYAQQDDSHYEMAEVTRSTDNLTAGGKDLTAFYSEISSIQDTVKTFNANISTIGDLHTRSLNSADDVAAKRTATQLEDLVAETNDISRELKTRIQDLERKGGGSGSDAESRRQQTAFVKSKFVEAIQNYQQVEQQYRQKNKQRIERQFKIVKPDATAEEVKAVVNDDQGGQIFTQDLLNSNRLGESRAAYREVQERHADIKKIEKTLTELAQLFNDMSVIVEQQDESVTAIHSNAVNIDTDIEVGLKHTEKAVESGRGARRKRWICFWISVLIAIIVIIIIVVALHPWQK